MFYTQTDREQVTAERTKRLIVVIVPAALLLLLAVASFVWFRLHRDTSGWFLTGLVTILGGSYFIFFQSVYLKPVSLYKRHVNYMLDGHKRNTAGYLKEIGTQVLDHEGLDCRTLTVNIGEKDAPEDDRLFYLDALKPVPTLALGTRVRVLSNDRMIAGLDLDDPQS
ncbi:MAG: hypothetical protein LLF96_05810 [Eubacteriales bacterium]|nr:hypothetical protein [Eubacteriales bacterium]